MCRWYMDVMSILERSGLDVEPKFDDDEQQTGKAKKGNHDDEDDGDSVDTEGFPKPGTKEGDSKPSAKSPSSREAKLKDPPKSQDDKGTDFETNGSLGTEAPFVGVGGNEKEK